MMVVHKRSALLQKVDDTLGVFHTHALTGFLSGTTTGLFAEPTLSSLFLSVTNSRGAVYGHAASGAQFMKQVAGAGFIVGWNAVVTTAICVLIRVVIPLRMTEEQLMTGDDAVHGEEETGLAWYEGAGLGKAEQRELG
ncbi:hypothetical protein Taro_028954 [Colocasia esculenta]|uniref:Ammonium transporter AmtB-like domain-containing protein n=1 Tax=Colocasia esculenta TaxID=4460 RepID=A0A843VYT2_COLES|nr:hypothetical protein [Colocasia esculenta]